MCRKNEISHGAQIPEQSVPLLHADTLIHHHCFLLTPTAPECCCFIYIFVDTVPAASASQGFVAPSYLHFTGEEIKEGNLKHRTDSSLESRAPKCGSSSLGCTHPPLYASETPLRTDCSMVTESEVQRVQWKNSSHITGWKEDTRGSWEMTSRDKPDFLCRTDKHLWITHPTCWPAGCSTAFAWLTLLSNPLQQVISRDASRTLLSPAKCWPWNWAVNSLRAEIMFLFFSLFPEFPTAQSWHWVTVWWMTHTQKSQCPTRIFYPSTFLTSGIEVNMLPNLFENSGF